MMLLETTRRRQKKDYDLGASCKVYYVGDAVYKLEILGLRVKYIT